MSQLSLNLIGVIDQAFEVPHEDIVQINSYRGAVRACWIHRRSKGMTQATLAERAEMHAKHIPEYLSESPINEKGKKVREMPAKYISAFQAVCGNTYVTQWLQYDAEQKILEAMRDERYAA